MSIHNVISDKACTSSRYKQYLGSLAIWCQHRFSFVSFVCLYACLSKMFNMDVGPLSLYGGIFTNVQMFVLLIAQPLRELGRLGPKTLG